jgi:adenylate cyclase
VRSVTPGWRVLLAGGLIGLAAGLAAVLDPFHLVEVAELKALDARFTLRGPRPPAAPIVMIAIDEDTFDELDLTWPFPRALHGELLDIVSRARPVAVGLDLIFDVPSSRGADDDEALAQAVARARNVVLGAALTAVQGSGFVKEDLNPPIRPIRDGAAAFGLAGFDTDSDAFIRRAALRRRFQDRDVTSIDVHLHGLAAAAGVPVAPLPPGPEMLINFAGGPGTFPRVPYYRVLNGEVSPDVFRGKIVLVGATTPVLHDRFPAPFAPRGDMAGVELHANVLDTLMQGIPLRRAPFPVAGLAAVLAGIGGVWAAAGRRPLPAFGLVAGAGLLYLAAGQAAFVWGRYWVEALPVPLALAVGYVGAVARNLVREQREKARLSRFFSPAVVAEIIRHRDEVNLGSSRRRMTVLFSDIRGFTAMSEKMPPEEVAAFLREYLTEMTEAVFRHGGTVDKYVGDAIMALYNVPFEAPDHAARAVRTALEFQRRLRPLAERVHATYGSRLRCGVGINTGDAVVGTIGSRQRLEYTAIGDTVNLGSRLEGLTKDFDVPIIIGEATHSEVKDLFETRYLGEVHVRGKEIPVKVYCVVDHEEEPPDQSRGGLPSTVRSTSRPPSK